MRRNAELTVLVTPWDDGFDLFVLDSDAGLLFQHRVTELAELEHSVRARLTAEHPDRAQAELVTIGP